MQDSGRRTRMREIRPTVKRNNAEMFLKKNSISISEDFAEVACQDVFLERGE